MAYAAGVDEKPLAGGITNNGAIVRVGHDVLRPTTPNTTAVHAFLTAIRLAGFDGAPMPIGIDSDGRQRLEFLNGDVPLSPYPAWSQTDTALASIAQLLSDLHKASLQFDPSLYTWNEVLADPIGGPLVCHNDLELSNIVFIDGVAVGFIDFEFAAPGRAVYDLAQFARLCVPIEHEFDQDRMGWEPADRPARLRLIADTYGLDQEGRAQLLTAIDAALDKIEEQARRSFDTADHAALARMEQAGGIEKFDRRRRWWQSVRSKFDTALRSNELRTQFEP